MSNRKQTFVAPRCLSAFALCIAVVLGAATPGFATTRGEIGNDSYGASVDVLSERRCQRAAKQERCDWVKRDHKLTTGY
jgi:hypothetical protein